MSATCRLHHSRKKCPGKVPADIVESKFHLTHELECHKTLGAYEQDNRKDCEHLVQVWLTACNAPDPEGGHDQDKKGPKHNECSEEPAMHKKINFTTITLPCFMAHLLRWPSLGKRGLSVHEGLALPDS